MTELSFEPMRRAMVASQLRTNAVSDPRVVAAMGSVPRERFVPADRAAIAYVDTMIPLGGGRMLNAPMVTGRLLTAAGVRIGEHALLIGAATGYSAALLDALGARVTALECDPALAAQARGLLADRPGVTVIEGPLADGWTAGEPYPLIFVDGAVETVPQRLIEQLADGGRLAAGLDERGVTRLGIGRKAGSGFGMVAFADAEVAALPGFEAPAGFTF